jgi:hypothetical protein
MIFTILVIGMLELVKLILGILPDAPATPSAVTSGGSWVTDQVGSVISVLNYVFTPALMTAVMVVVVAMFTWEYIYAAAMWLIRKIPMINIK